MKRLVLLAAVLGAAAFPATAQTAVAPVRWCGDAVSTDRIPDRSGGPQVHVVYATPADGEDRFGAIASALATDVAGIDDWWRREDPLRAPRFDLFEFPGCESRFGRLDITSVRLPDPDASLVSLGSRFPLLTARLASLDLDDESKKYLVYYDGTVGGPGGDQNVCGQGSGAPQGRGVAVVYLRASCTQTTTVAAHELLHAMGALPFGAPSACPEDRGHPCDDPADLLFPFLNDKPLEQTLLDSGRNDYYGHLGDWFDVQDSSWLLRAQAQMLLQVGVGAGGRVEVGSSGRCTTPCVTEWDAGTNVELGAEAGAGFVFDRWGGACSGGDSTCRLTVDTATTVTATFARLLALNVSVTGRGVVRFAGVRCSRSCRTDVVERRPVTLRAAPARGWRFARWTGACRGTRAGCTLRPARASRVRAVFARR